MNKQTKSRIRPVNTENILTVCGVGAKWGKGTGR